MSQNGAAYDPKARIADECEQNAESKKGERGALMCCQHTVVDRLDKKCRQQCKETQEEAQAEKLQERPLETAPDAT